MIDDTDETPPQPPICGACDEVGHSIQSCPEIRDLLFAPFTDVCVSCGDQIPYDAPLNTVCGACQEWGITAIQTRAALALALEVSQ